MTDYKMEWTTTLQSIRMLIAAAALIAVFMPGQYAADGQQQVNLRQSAPPLNHSIRYNKPSRLLPSESRYLIIKSGLLPSEHRHLRWKTGVLPSSGAAAHLQQPTIRYNKGANYPSGLNRQPTIRYYSTPVRQSPFMVKTYRVDTRIRPQSPKSQPSIRYTPVPYNPDRYTPK